MFSSILSKCDFREEPLELVANIMWRELPVDSFLTAVAIWIPVTHSVIEFFLIVPSVGNTLSGQYAQFRFRNVHPAAMF